VGKFCAIAGANESAAKPSTTNLIAFMLILNA
jgi:hypothetical protein